MDYRDALRALADGKRVRDIVWMPGQFVELIEHRNADPALKAESGQIMTFEDCIYTKSKFELYTEPNPHTPGTFAWARLEAERGHEVRRPGMHGSFGAKCFMPNEAWELRAIDSADWEIAK